jgi:hypothetical protein
LWFRLSAQTFVWTWLVAGTNIYFSEGSMTGDIFL